MFYSLVINLNSIYSFLGSLLGSFTPQDPNYTLCFLPPFPITPFAIMEKLITPFGLCVYLFTPFLLTPILMTPFGKGVGKSSCQIRLLLKRRSCSRPLDGEDPIYALLGVLLPMPFNFDALQDALWSQVQVCLIWEDSRALWGVTWWLEDTSGGPICEWAWPQPKHYK